jgi:zinc/manganese transport system substrate-binding protein/manganese/iron transport system substrate-binding protein
MVRQVAGDRAEITVLLPPDADPHQFEPRPADITALNSAQALFMNGAGLEEFLEPLLRNASGERLVVACAEGLTLRMMNEDGTTVEDPHLWFDVRNAMHYVERIRDGLIQADPAGQATYTANADRYLTQLRDLDQWIIDQVGQLPAERRNLVTSHDTFGYFAARYGFEVIGTLFPTTGVEAEPLAQEIAALIEAIKASGVKAIFTENTVDPKFAEQIAADAGVEVVTGLYTDALGGPGSGAETYVDMMRFDVNAIVEALQ